MYYRNSGCSWSEETKKFLIILEPLFIDCEESYNSISIIEISVILNYLIATLNFPKFDLTFNIIITWKTDSITPRNQKPHILVSISCSCYFGNILSKFLLHNSISILPVQVSHKILQNRISRKRSTSPHFTALFFLFRLFISTVDPFSRPWDHYKLMGL